MLKYCCDFDMLGFGICFIVFSWSSCKAYLVVNLICICSSVNKIRVAMLNGPFPSVLQQKRWWISQLLDMFTVISWWLCVSLKKWFLKEFWGEQFHGDKSYGKTYQKGEKSDLFKILGKLQYCSVFSILMGQVALIEGQQWLLAFFFIVLPLSTHTSRKAHRVE